MSCCIKIRTAEAENLYAAQSIKKKTWVIPCRKKISVPYLVMFFLPIKIIFCIVRKRFVQLYFTTALLMQMFNFSCNRRCISVVKYCHAMVKILKPMDHDKIYEASVWQNGHKFNPVFHWIKLNWILFWPPDKCYERLILPILLIYLVLINGSFILFVLTLQHPHQSIFVFWLQHCGCPNTCDNTCDDNKGEIARTWADMNEGKSFAYGMASEKRTTTILNSIDQD